LKIQALLCNRYEGAVIFSFPGLKDDAQQPQQLLFYAIFVLKIPTGRMLLSQIVKEKGG
jgi:hypothetical protein